MLPTNRLKPNPVRLRPLTLPIIRFLLNDSTNLSIKTGESSLDPSGLLLVDKPSGISSFDIIRILRRQTAVRKIGHAGTLDPAATGLMLMLFNKATKQAGQLSGLNKRYEAEITLGATSTTGDREGEIIATDHRRPALSEVAAALHVFTGSVTQTPSVYSAIKVEGVRAYKLARAGKKVIMPSREVTIHSIKLVSYSFPIIGIEAHVSSGTYIRSLAADVGTYLGTGGYLSRLRRIQVGAFTIASAYQLGEVQLSTLKKQLVTASDLTKS
ncbi:MAG TPA: tRNA pseudouridine(55) synthase TruB [Candidatus Saccharimonadia bacterium]